MCFTVCGMDPGGGSGVVKPINVDPEDVGLLKGPYVVLVIE